MEKLEINHIAPYLPYGLKVKHESIDEDVTEICNLESLSLDCITFDNGCDYYFEDSDCDNPIIKPLLHPLSDLYKEIDGKVGIVEIAKMLSGTVLVEKIDGCCTNLSYFKCTFEDGFEELIINENCEGWYRSYFDKNQPSTGRNVINQFEVFQYLFQHHYDVSGLIDKGLAIDLNSISHE